MYLTVTERAKYEQTDWLQITEQKEYYFILNTQHDAHNEIRKPIEVSTYRLSTRKSASPVEFTFYSTRQKALNQHHSKLKNHHVLPNISQFEKTEFIKNCFFDCIMDTRTHIQYDKSITNIKGLKNLLIKCDDYIVNCEVDERRHTKIQNSSIPLENEFCWKNTLDFVKLLFTSHHVNRKTLSSKFWTNVLLPVIEDKDSILCHFFLTIMTNIETSRWELFYPFLLEGLSSSMVNQDKDTSKVLAWFVTKKFFLSLDKSIRDKIIDIWPAYNCSCYRGKDAFCSGKIEITVEICTLFPDLPDTFWKVDIHFISADRVKHKESSQILENLQNSNSKLHFRNKETVSSEDAKQLFIAHTNLTLVCKSLFKSTGFQMKKHKVIEQPCVQLYCKRKGLIPIGEKHFPKTLNGLQTDILEGCPNLLTKLKIGNKVGRDDDLKRGTLGGFVEVRGVKAFLTCLHVFLSTEELASDNISLDDKKKELVKVHIQNKTSICGIIRDIAYEVDNHTATSIDAALVEISETSIDKSNYVDVNSGQLAFKDLGMTSEYLNDSCVDYRSLLFTEPKLDLRAVGVGAVSGYFDNSNAQVYENHETYIDVELIENVYSGAIINEIKKNVNIVMQSLQNNPITVLQYENIIKMHIQQNCESQLSPAIQTIIFEVVQHMYKSSSDDIDNVILHKTKNRYSEINGDVHMQIAFLQQTGRDMARKRTTRRIYKQIHITNIPFQPGDSGTCIYVLSPVNFKGCIGMAIADHPQGGCIATPIMDILKHFKIRIK